MSGVLDDWKRLLANVEAATRPHRELDAQLAILLDGPERWYNAPAQLVAEQVTSEEELPPVTASLDAITALIEHEMPGKIWSVIGGYETKKGLGQLDGPYPNDFEMRASPALALLSAFLRARIAELEQKERAA